MTDRQAFATPRTPGAGETPAPAPALAPAVSDFVVWQLVDSALPAGGFAHSQGVEAALQAGAITDVAALRRHARAALENAARLALPFVRAACLYPTSADAAALSAALHALLSVHVARRASLTQGAALVRLALRTFPEACASLQPLLALTDPPADAAAAAPPPLHHPCVLGAVCGALGVPWLTACRMFAWGVMRDTVSAATRLNVIGPQQAAALQAELGPAAEAALQLVCAEGAWGTAADPAAARPRAAAADEEALPDPFCDAPEASVRLALASASSSAPLQDIFQGGSDELFTRLFCS